MCIYKHYHEYISPGKLIFSFSFLNFHHPCIYLWILHVRNVKNEGLSYLCWIILWLQGLLVYKYCKEIPKLQNIEDSLM